jgi:hypothetical protein
VGPRAGLYKEDRGKILLPPPGIEPRSPGRPARSQTLYCLSYPAPSSTVTVSYVTITPIDPSSLGTIHSQYVEPLWYTHRTEVIDLALQF